MSKRPAQESEAAQSPYNRMHQGTELARQAQRLQEELEVLRRKQSYMEGKENAGRARASQAGVVGQNIENGLRIADKVEMSPNLARYWAGVQSVSCQKLHVALRADRQLPRRMGGYLLQRLGA